MVKNGVLFLDVEGGWGGSSRSMYYLIESLDRRRWSPVAVLRSPGPNRERYKRLGVSCAVIPELAPFRPADRKNFLAYLLHLWATRRWPAVRRKLDRLAERHPVGLVHVNHESLALQGIRVARHFDCPLVCHIRTQLTPSRFARWLCRRIADNAAAVICIVDPVRDHFRRLAGTHYRANRVHVVHNIAPAIDGHISPLPEIVNLAPRFRVVSLSSFSRNRGVDRVLDVASALRERGETDFVFLLYGRPGDRRAVPWLADRYWPYVQQRAKEEELGDIVRFPGHIAEPERVLAGADALIKLTRQSNPWGRDIMEALAAGLPVVTLGDYRGFVEADVNGYISSSFDPGEVAEFLVRLRNDRTLVARIAAANRDKAARLFSGAARAREVQAIYESVL